MNIQAFAILFIPLVGLASIFRGGHFRWRVVKSSRLLNTIFWFGWFSTLIVGLLVLAGIVRFA